MRNDAVGSHALEKQPLQEATSTEEWFKRCTEIIFFFWHGDGLSTQQNRSCSLQTLSEEWHCSASRGWGSPDPLSGRREPTPLPGEQEWINCPTVPWSKNTLLFSQTIAAVCSLVTSLHRQPLINFHRVSISLWAVMSNSSSVDYFTSSSGRSSQSSSPFHRCSNVAVYINKAAAMDMVHSSNHLHYNNLDI